MARNESNREDLLREATALVERVEIKDNVSSDESIVVGFRVDGALSIFFGDDPVYQFNSAGELRRAFYEGLLFKAAQGGLVSLSRIRHAELVELRRHDLIDAEQHAFLETMASRIDALKSLLDSPSLTIVGQVPDGANVIGRVRRWLKEHQQWTIADSARL